MKRAQWRFARRQLTWMRRMEDVALIDRTGRDDAEVAGRDRRDARADGIACARDAVREVAGARQRLRDRRARRASLGADAGARSGGSASPTSGSAPTASCCSRAAADDRHVAELRIFNPDGSEAELSGNGAREAVLYLRAAGWTDADDVHDPHARPARSRRRSPGPSEVSMALGRASVTSADYPVGARGRPRHARRRAAASGASST